MVNFPKKISPHFAEKKEYKKPKIVGKKRESVVNEMIELIKENRVLVKKNACLL